MGYFTTYDLSLYGEEEKCEKFTKDFVEEYRDDDGYVDPAIRELAEKGYTYAKLYDLEDMIAVVAKRNPDVLIVLTGDGEDSDDLWETRWKGDQSERHFWCLPPFQNPELLLDKEKTNQ